MNDKCSECGAYKGHGFIAYGEPCPHLTRGELIEELRRYYKAWRENSDKFHSRMAEYQQRMQLWHGKWAIVKHENNQLRKKLFKTTTHE